MMSDAINQLAELLDSSDAIPVFRHAEVHAAFRDLQQQLDAANQRIELMESQRNAAMECERKDATQALHALASTHYATPETYGSNSSWAVMDLCRAVKDFHRNAVAANQRVAELTRDYAVMRVEASKEFDRAEAAERKLATAQGALRYYANQDNWDVLPKLQTSSGADCLQIDEGIGYAVAVEALAQIEQP